MAGGDAESKAHSFNDCVFTSTQHDPEPLTAPFFFKHANKHFKQLLGIFPSQVSPLFAKSFWTRQDATYFLLGDCLVCRPVCACVCVCTAQLVGRQISPTPLAFE